MRVPLLSLPALILAALSAAGAQQSPARPNVLLITLDTVRADRLGAYGYTLAETPNLDRLARDGVRFADATTQSPLTAPAHAALFTGQYPTRFGLRINGSTPLPASAVTLAEALEGAGYQPPRSSVRSWSIASTGSRKASTCSTRTSRGIVPRRSCASSAPRRR